MIRPSRDETNNAYRSALDRLCEGLDPAWRISEIAGIHVTWRVFQWTRSDLPEQGWKIHISADASGASRLLEIVVPLLLEHRATFKLPNTAEAIVDLNSGAVGESQIGKVVTVYPRDDREAAGLAKAIDAAWSDAASPVVVSDLLLRQNSAVSIRYGAFAGDSVIIDPAGTYHHAIRRPDGSLVVDERDLGGEQPGWAPSPPISGVTHEAPGEWQTFVVGGRKYYNMAAIHSGAQSRVIFAIDMEHRKTVILKIARRGVGGDLLGNDARDRLRHEFEILEETHPKGAPVPRPIAFSDGDLAVLVLEDTPAKSFERLARDELIASLPLLADAVARFHALGFAHCDLKPGNALRGEDGVWLIDLGLATRLGEPRTFPGWTAGYASATEASGGVTDATDVYALGACLAGALLGCEPGELLPGTGRILGLLAVEGAFAGAEMVRLLCHPDSEHRPSAAAAAVMLRERMADLEVPGSRTHVSVRRRDRQWIRRSACEAALSTRGYKVTDDGGCYWRNQHPSGDFAWEGINHGAAGIILGLATVDTALDRDDFAADIASGAEWLITPHGHGGSAGLFTGDAGVALALLVAGLRLGRNDFIHHARLRLMRAVSICSRLDLYSGAAGVLWAGHLMSELIGEQWPLNIVGPKLKVLLERSEEQGGFILWPDDEGDSSHGQYLGAAHGSAGIAMSLAIWATRTGDGEISGLAHRTFLGLHTNARSEDGTFKARANSPASPQPLSWCHGAAGYLWCLLQSCGREPRFQVPIDCAVESVFSLPPGSNASYCHGLAGQLELWRMVSRYERHRALARFAQAKVTRALRLVQRRRDGQAIWSTGEPGALSPDIWNGFLGPATALSLYASGVCDSIFSVPWLRACSRRSSP